jgi:hypothetical protein
MRIIRIRVQAWLEAKRGEATSGLFAPCRGDSMDEARPEVIVASTLYLISGCILDPSPCACRVKAIVAHLERMMSMDGLDPVLRATAIQLHENWCRVAREFDEPAHEPVEATHTWH